jgi:hypothetical protein
MGQLESYTMQDIYLVAILSGVLSTYFAEEIEATIESVVAYVYSANYTTKKKCAIAPRKLPAGDIIGAMYTSENFLRLSKANFIAIDKPLDEKTIWQDQFLTKWTGVQRQDVSINLEDRYNWNA